MEIGGGTKVFALLGDPVAHSLSPLMQNAAFRTLGLDAVYVPLRCSSNALAALMETLAAEGGGGNVTIPHKARAAGVLASQGAIGMPVCNTFWGRNGHLEGAETDSGAMLAALSRLGSPGGPWLVIGTGGSASAALLAARKAGVAVAVQSRSVERASQFAAVADEAGVELVEPATCEVVLNCTPLGMRDGDPLPLQPERAPPGRVALDLVYRRGETAWVRAMRSAGWQAADGREVLLEQGATAFELWFPGLAAPREAMRAAVHAALG